MELASGSSLQDNVLIGFEEIYGDPFFSKLRLALNKSSERQKLFEILTAVGSLDPLAAPFLTKMREALDRPGERDFWVWLNRAFREIDRNNDSLDLLRNALSKEESLDFNLGLLRFIESPPFEHKNLFSRVRRALEHNGNGYCVESLRIFEEFSSKPFLFLNRLRKHLEDDGAFETQNYHLIKGFEEFEQWRWSTQLRKTFEKFKDQIRLEFLSRSQIRSKKWAVQKIEEYFGSDLGFAHILCGWYGLMGTLLHLTGKFPQLKLRSYDLDPSCEAIADELNRPWVADGWKFKAFTMNIFDLEVSTTPNGPYLHFTDKSGKPRRYHAELIINTSCEHLENFEDWYARLPSGTPLLLQTNNSLGEEDHVNCKGSLEEFKASAPMARLLYEGALPCENFTRYMLIGYK